MSYKWIKTNEMVQRLADGANIPADPANRDWRRFQEWRAAGNTPEPADPLPVVTPPRDLAAEIDELKAKVAKAEADIVTLKAPKP